MKFHKIQDIVKVIATPFSKILIKATFLKSVCTDELFWH